MSCLAVAPLMGCGSGGSDRDAASGDAPAEQPAEVGGGDASDAIDGAGNLFVADTGNHAVRRIDLTTGAVLTVVLAVR